MTTIMARFSLLGFSICSSLIWILGFGFLFLAAYWYDGLEWTMPHFEGTLVAADKSNCYRDRSTGYDCAYNIFEYFVYANNTGYCSVSRAKSYNEDRIDEAIANVVLGTTRTVWLKPKTSHSCYDVTNIKSNLSEALGFGVPVAVGSFLIWCLLICRFVMSSRGPTNMHTAIPRAEEVHGGRGRDEEEGGLELTTRHGRSGVSDGEAEKDTFEMANAVITAADVDLSRPSNVGLVSADQVAVALPEF